MPKLRRSGSPEQDDVRKQVGLFVKGAGKALVASRRRKVATGVAIALLVGCGILYALGYGDAVPLLIEAVLSFGSEA